MQAAWMIAGAFFFASMAVGVKFASASYNAFEITFYRGIVGVFFMAWMARANHVSLRTSVPLMHLWRNVVGVTALVFWFYAIAKLPLATAMTLNYMSGIWMAVFLVGGTLATGSGADIRRQGPLIAAVMFSFVGVVMMLRPTLGQNQLFAGLIGLLSGLMAALAYMQVAALGRLGEPEVRVVFYFSVGASLTGLIGMLCTGGAHAWRWPAAAWLLPIGVLAALGQWSLTRAYTRGATMVVANLQYSGIVFAALYGLLLFHNPIAWMGWLGIALIIASGIAATVLRARALPARPPEEIQTLPPCHNRCTPHS
ncbi:MAG: DMT family transporter [Burkholderiaceae bacterium]|jgi:S-adenosylmethionine uptake transporter|nr:DMT family transporter [Burkholderiaceae bacterium]